MKDVISEFRQLVQADETPAALDRALSLVNAVASGRGRSERWSNLLNGAARPQLPSAPARGSMTTRRADEVVRVLAKLPSRAEEIRDKINESQFSMLFDALLIVFHQAYFALLPKVTGSKRNELLAAFLTFARSLPRVADQLHIEGLVRLSMGESAAAVDLFRAAVASTPSDDHDFLSRVQLYWTVLMEADRSADAFEFLSEIASRVTRNDFTEFQGLLSTTFKVATHQLS
jgi:hypothetical protein